MIRPLNDEEKIKLSKLRVDHPYKLLWGWLFSFKHVSDDFEYVFSVKDSNWRIISIKIVFLIPIYLLVGIYKVCEFCLSPFNVDRHLETIFEFLCCILILTTFGGLRIPYAIYTYMRFNKANALIYMLKSD